MDDACAPGRQARPVREAVLHPSADVHEAYDLPTRAELVLSEGFMWRHHPQAAGSRATLPELGELQTIRATFASSMGPDRATDIRLQADLEGGSLMDVGCYCVSGARLLAGEEPETVYGPRRAGARAASTCALPASSASRAASWPNSRRAFTMDHRGLEAIGEEGSAMLLDPWQADPATLVRDGEITHWHPDDPKPMEVPYFHEFDNFSAAVRGESEPLLGRDDAAGPGARPWRALRVGSDAAGKSRSEGVTALAADDADIVIVGAGAAGCVLARRLAERTGAAVLLLEAGGEPDVTRLRMAGALGSPPTGASRPNPDRQVARNPCDEGGCWAEPRG